MTASDQGQAHRSDLVGVLRRARAARVVVLGDVMLDQQVKGSAQRLSPEAPVPVLRPVSRLYAAGGAANVALNVAAMGVSTTLIGVTGCDQAADTLAGLLDRHERLTNRVHCAQGRVTTLKIRYVCGGQQLLRVDEEDTSPVSANDQAQLIGSLREVMGEAQVLILSDYRKGVLCDGMLASAIDLAREAGAKIVVDPKLADLTAYAHATVITPNEHEAQASTGIDTSTDAGAAAAAQAIMERTGIQAVVVTRASKGLTMMEAGQVAQHISTDAREVADVSGAGDTFVAALSVALAGGARLCTAARLANVGAGIAVARHGTTVVSDADIENTLVLRDLTTTDKKIVTLQEAAACARTWRRLGVAVGFTNGCFDLVHPGHVRLLASARASCDRLIVGLNSDSSVRRLKGHSRPLQNEVARATVLASLAAVDLVVIFEEDTPIDLINAIEPALLVKGADYRRDQVVGADLVETWGGEVMLVQLEEGHSTSTLVSRARDQQVA
ncbi:MAG: D-glycero-beta-D-manno-heptose 1-phosphate adenylyltransferase [Acidobacteriaceae bacterium]|nr:D-glycero-beta-D-manno-heptose 1-phosphate adenylyltransferase [Acidobacteriaceae bacterium]